ncbi:hypothetical protein HYQ45_018240 [Verticillium longisporum]|uniref:Uncharacterized protein n=1 Tax=Verticillium longisporum TaxID=100787 RepID=A0A8I3AGH4_VERLO|nr:hypothetical protein HYQ45_018240 [Verticillium longisporum]
MACELWAGRGDEAERNDRFWMANNSTPQPLYKAIHPSPSYIISLSFPYPRSSSSGGGAFYNIQYICDIDLRYLPSILKSEARARGREEPSGNWHLQWTLKTTSPRHTPSRNGIYLKNPVERRSTL